jgi:acetylornithine deacetylase/succinyl-diaminopimelate desuccinylase-like protein
MGRAEDEVVTLTSELIQIDSQNTGELATTTGEAEAAAYVDAKLREVGYETEVVESGAPGRRNVFARLKGADPDRPALLVHGHLDVVPARAADWSIDPFSGEVRDGSVWGRGALDMKDFDATMLAVIRRWARAGVRPRRDTVFAFVADEEDTGEYGAGFLVGEYAHLFDGVTDAIGESGGADTRLPDGSTLFTIAAAERGTAWMKLTARGEAGHGSRPFVDNAVKRLVRGLARLSDHEWPTVRIPAVAALLDGLQEHLGITVDPTDRADLARLGAIAPMLETTLRTTVNPTMLSAGYKVNVIPSEAVAHVDMRLLPGAEDEALATVDRLLGPGITREFDSRQDPVQSPVVGPTWDAMVAALRAEAPDALILPFCMGGGTDAKWFSKLGISCYGFTPARYPADFHASDFVHGVDEHTPVDALQFGARVLDRFLTDRD